AMARGVAPTGSGFGAAGVMPRDCGGGMVELPEGEPSAGAPEDIGGGVTEAGPAGVGRSGGPSSVRGAPGARVTRLGSSVPRAPDVPAAPGVVPGGDLFSSVRGKSPDFGGGEFPAPDPGVLDAADVPKPFGADGGGGSGAGGAGELPPVVGEGLTEFG